MDYVKPVDVATAMVETGRRKLTLGPVDLLIRGGMLVLTRYSSSRQRGQAATRVNGFPRNREQSPM